MKEIINDIRLSKHLASPNAAALSHIVMGTGTWGEVRTDRSVPQR